MSVTSLFALVSNDMYSVNASTAVAPSAMYGVMLFLLGMIFITYIVVSIMLSRIFRKAGVSGWKAWIPVYNTWITLELGGQRGWWALVMLIPIINIAASVFLYIAMYHIGIKLGKDGAFVLWAIFLPIVWYIWLAFDQSSWRSTPRNDDPATPPTPASVV